jgi:hypothetical protein
MTFLFWWRFFGWIAAIGFVLFALGLIGSGVAMLLRPPEFNVVKDCGADPTGVTDSSAAIADCMGRAEKAGGEVVWPPGYYRATSLRGEKK